MTETKWAKLERLIHLAGGSPAAQAFLEALKDAPEIEVKVETKSAVKPKAKTKKKGGK